MDDLRTRAELVAFDPARAGAVGTVISRAEIAETAARGEFPATLLLDLDRFDSADGGEVTAHATVALDWDKATLDQLLASTEADEIGLWFDERELAVVFEEGEVEGHGLRQRAAIFAVAAAAASASATPALARTVEAAGGPGAQPAGVRVAHQADGQRQAAWDAGAVRGLQVDQQLGAPNAPSTIGRPSASTPSGDEATKRLLPQQLSSGEREALEAAGVVLLISAAGFGVARKRRHPLRPA